MGYLFQTDLSVSISPTRSDEITCGRVDLHSQEKTRGMDIVQKIGNNFSIFVTFPPDDWRFQLWIQSLYTLLSALDIFTVNLNAQFEGISYR
jgi:hypothetical protein